MGDVVVGRGDRGVVAFELGEGRPRRVAREDARVDGVQDRGGHAAEGGGVLVAVGALAQVDLGDGVEAGGAVGVDEQARLDAVAGREGQGLQQ